jgi:hypothetical protein
MPPEVRHVGPCGVLAAAGQGAAAQRRQPGGALPLDGGLKRHATPPERRKDTVRSTQTFQKPVGSPCPGNRRRLEPTDRIGGSRAASQAAAIGCGSEEGGARKKNVDGVVVSLR